ncbi:NSFL1 cofactor p47 [Armadillidium vulgare]|nr:NSFL1 cofactor p47 [Armadillidium vulgare]
MADDKEKLIEQFCAVSGVDAERSKFYLESAAWNIEAALGSLYEEGDDTAPETVEETKKPEKGPDMPKVSMFDSDSSDDEGQAFYAGGSEHSGQQVLGPSKKKKDVVSMLFKSAKEHGAEVLESKDKSGKKKINFVGTGYRLGVTESDHEVISGASKEAEQPKDVTLKMWRTGFTVDGGPLREYNDPANHEFLDSVRKGQVPMELVKSARGGEVYINMEDHRHEDYVTDKPKVVAFTGSGHTLGSPAPTVIGQVTDTGTPGGSSDRTIIGPTKVEDTSSSSSDDKAKEELDVDPSKPVTNVQIRLPDGSRLVLKLNHTNTVGDIRRFVISSRPQIPTPFALMTTFPFATLSDDTKTISEGNLLNATIVLK